MSSSSLLRSSIQRVGKFVKTSFAVVGFGVTAVGVGYAYQLKEKRRKDLEEFLKADNNAKNGGGGRVLVVPFHRIELVDKHKQSKSALFKDGLEDLLSEDGKRSSRKKGKIEKISVEELVDVIHEAAQDPMITGMIGEFGHERPFGSRGGGSGVGGLADLEEIRNALRVFKESHRIHKEPNIIDLGGGEEGKDEGQQQQQQGQQPIKPMIAYADTFSACGGGRGNPDYYLASVFGEIHLHACGSLNLFGFGNTIPLLGKTLQQYGAKVYCYKHGLYKNAPNIFTDSALSKEHRANEENLWTTLNDYQNDSIEYSRLFAAAGGNFKITEDMWQLIPNSGSFTPEAALRMGFIDSITTTTSPVDNWFNYNNNNTTATDTDDLDYQMWLYNTAAAATTATGGGGDAQVQHQQPLVPFDPQTTSAIGLGDYRKHIAKRKQYQKQQQQQNTKKNTTSEVLIEKFTTPAGRRKAYDFLQKTTQNNPTLRDKVNSMLQNQTWYTTFQQQQEETSSADNNSKTKKVPVVPEKEKIALITIKGAINEKTVRQLEPSLDKIRSDAAVKCVVLRIDSPGGTLDASETILQQLIQLQQQPRRRVVRRSKQQKVDKKKNKKNNNNEKKKNVQKEENKKEETNESVPQEAATQEQQKQGGDATAVSKEGEEASVSDTKKIEDLKAQIKDLNSKIEKAESQQQQKKDDSSSDEKKENDSSSSDESKTATTTATDTTTTTTSTIFAPPPKIIVSFGNVAASGGYYIASHADQIFASQNTITGSIGVYGIRFDLSGVAERYGVQFGYVTTSDFALSESIFAPVTKLQHANSMRNVDRAYERFKQVVIQGRQLHVVQPQGGTSDDDDALEAAAQEYLRTIAEGRIWTGYQAKQNGLVDEIGGLHRAIEYGKRNYCDNDDTDSIEVVDMNEDKSWFAKLNKLILSGGGGGLGGGLGALALFLHSNSNSNSYNENFLLQQLIGNIGGGAQHITNSKNILLPKMLVPNKAFGLYLTMDENAAIQSLLESGMDSASNKDE